MQWNYILKTLKFTIISQFILNYHQYNIFLEQLRSPWEVHAEPLGLRGAQVGNLWSRAFLLAHPKVMFKSKGITAFESKKMEGDGVVLGTIHKVSTIRWTQLEAEVLQGWRKKEFEQNNVTLLCATVHTTEVIIGNYPAHLRGSGGIVQSQCPTP